MRTTKDVIFSYLLTPLSWIYGAVTNVRNKLYDWHMLKAETFDVPIICVGNITVGGTGKTPHVEYLIEYLSSVYNIAVLSRGYKRKTRGFVLGTHNSTPRTIGDESYQILSKYGNRVKVAVCESRRKGIRELMNIDPSINLIILDDAYQHRSVEAKVKILLMDYNRPVYTDHVLPLGRLRESKRAVGRADIVVVTKMPDDAAPLQYRIGSNNLDLWAFQKLFFSRIDYGQPLPVFPDDSRYTVRLDSLTRNDIVLLLTGIANPRPLVRYFKNFECRVKINHFPDHHDFSRNDLQRLQVRYDEMKGARKLIVTTEKDAVRLANNPYFPEKLKPYIFYLPISVDMLGGIDGSNFINAVKSAIEASPNNIGLRKGGSGDTDDLDKQE